MVFKLLSIRNVRELVLWNSFTNFDGHLESSGSFGRNWNGEISCGISSFYRKLARVRPTYPNMIENAIDVVSQSTWVPVDCTCLNGKSHNWKRLSIHPALSTMHRLLRTSVTTTKTFGIHARFFSTPITLNSKSTLTLPADTLPPSHSHTLPLRWLRDSCQCPFCVHPSTRQKLHRTSDVLGARPVEAELTDGALNIVWSEPESNSIRTDQEHQSTADERTHPSVYTLDWLSHYTSPAARSSFHHYISLSPILWDRETLLSRSPALFVDYAVLSSPSHPENVETLKLALTQLLRFGLVFVRGVPNERTDDVNCELRNLAGIFGRIRETFYGQVWDVRSVRDSKNIAYTNLDLGLHMDLLCVSSFPSHREPPIITRLSL